MTTNLLKKMVEITKEVHYIKKNGRNQFHKYNYASEADVSARFSEAFSKHGVYMSTSVLERECLPFKTKKGEDWFLITVKVEMTFSDSESDEKITIHSFGDGADSGDKGVYKAITGAVKYGLMKNFLVETGDDPEKDVPIEPIKPIKLTEEKLEKFLTFWGVTNNIAIKDKWLHNVKSTYLINDAQLSAIEKSISLAVDRQNTTPKKNNPVIHPDEINQHNEHGQGDK